MENKFVTAFSGQKDEYLCFCTVAGTRWVKVKPLARR
jgi:hypothetical protein